MKLISRSLSLATLLGIASAANAQLTFNFEFDNTADGTVTPPIVGTGTLTLASDPGNGIFAYNTLGPTFSFSFLNGSSFDQTHVVTPTANVQVQIVPSGMDRVLTFGGSGGGPFVGSLDLVNGGTNLSFQPNFGVLYFNNSGANFGTYSAIAAVNTAVPEPGSIALLVGAGIGGMMLRRRKK